MRKVGMNERLRVIPAVGVGRPPHGGVRTVLETVQWTVSGSNGRSPWALPNGVGQVNRAPKSP